MTFWKALWENPHRAYGIGLVSWLLAIGILLLILSKWAPDLPTQVAMAVIAAGCFGVWSLMFSIAAIASYARIVGGHNEERFRALEARLNKQGVN